MWADDAEPSPRVHFSPSDVVRRHKKKLAMFFSGARPYSVLHYPELFALIARGQLPCVVSSRHIIHCCCV